MGFYAQQRGTTIPPMRMQQAGYDHNYSGYNQQMHMTSNEDYKEQMGSILQVNCFIIVFSAGCLKGQLHFERLKF